MTTETWLRPGDDGTLVLTRVPRPGTVLVRSAKPPIVPRARCTDVRPGPLAVYDGVRHRGTIHVGHGRDRRSLPSDDLAAVAEAVEEALDGSDVVRFGDRAACRSLLTVPTAASLERRLVDIVTGRRGTLLTWTGGTPGDDDRRTYDVVVVRRAGEG